MSILFLRRRQNIVRKSHLSFVRPSASLSNFNQGKQIKLRETASGLDFTKIDCGVVSRISLRAKARAYFGKLRGR